MLTALAEAVGRAVARFGFRTTWRRRRTILLIETDGDVGFVLEAILRDDGFAVLRRDQMDLRDCLRRDIVLASIGLQPEAADDVGWLRPLRARCPGLPLLIVASSLGGPLRLALATDRHARVLYHPVTADEYLAAVADLLQAPPAAPACRLPPAA